MPRLAVPTDMPAEVATIIEVIGNHVRTEILHRLAAAPATAMELAAAMDVAHSSVHRHLVELEGHGLVVADAEPGQRRGNKNVVWRVDGARVAQVGQLWIAYATAKDAAQDPSSSE